jgi:hypothetical protein
MLRSLHSSMRLLWLEKNWSTSNDTTRPLRLSKAFCAFNVDPNIISKCLWMAALSDDDITERSRQHE